MNQGVPGEERRLEMLHDLSILDTGEEETFDRITRIAGYIFGAPIALVSLVDRDRQWFKSHLGLDARETPREQSFCAHAIGGTAPLVVSDARIDERFRENPLVVGDPQIRFYAGAQLRTEEGIDLGTLCIIDREPRPIPDEKQLQTLKDLAATATVLIVQRRLRIEATHAKAEAESATEAMREFFSRMSHDLRTPLGAILGYSEFLREADLSSEQREDVEEIHEAGRKMLSLVDNLLSASRETIPDPAPEPIGMGSEPRHGDGL